MIVNAYVRAGFDRINLFRNLFEHAVVPAAAAVEQHQQCSKDWAKLLHFAAANRTWKFYQDSGSRESYPERAIEGAILDGFAHVLGCDIGLAVEIGDRARDFQDPIVGAGAEV